MTRSITNADVLVLILQGKDWKDFWYKTNNFQCCDTHSTYYRVNCLRLMKQSIGSHPLIFWKRVVVYYYYHYFIIIIYSSAYRR
jgi:hypothetical protein